MMDALSSPAETQAAAMFGMVPTTRLAASISEKATCSWDTTTTPTIGSMVLFPGEDIVFQQAWVGWRIATSLQLSTKIARPLGAAGSRCGFRAGQGPTAGNVTVLNFDLEGAQPS